MKSKLAVVMSESVMAQVAHQRHAFQKNFRQHHRRSDVEINPAAIHLSDQFAQEVESQCESLRLVRRRQSLDGSVRCRRRS